MGCSLVNFLIGASFYTFYIIIVVVVNRIYNLILKKGPSVIIDYYITLKFREYNIPDLSGRETTKSKDVTTQITSLLEEYNAKDAVSVNDIIFIV